MADHLFDPSIARRLMAYPLKEEEIALGVDSDIDNPLVDLSDVTRVKTAGGNIQAIGKGIDAFEAFDTGIFFCGSVLFAALESCVREGGDVSLSRAVQKLADGGQARAVDVAGRFWIDVDDPDSFKRAENALLSEIGPSGSSAVESPPEAAQPAPEKTSEGS